MPGHVQEPYTVQLNHRLQVHLTLKTVASTLQHDEELVPGYPDNDQRWKGWFTISGSPKIEGTIETSKYKARESAARAMIGYVNSV